jgi:hypothetical protein
MEGSIQTRKEHNLNQQQDLDLGHKLNTADSKTKICKGYGADSCRKGNKYGHYKRNTPLATHICVAKSPNKCCYDLYQRMLYVLLKVALQGSIATHIYALVSDVYKCCKLATDVFHQRIHVLL